MQTSQLVVRIGHRVSDCTACGCGDAGHICGWRCSPADCSIRYQSDIVGDQKVDDPEVRWPVVAIASCSLHQQTRQSIRHLIPIEPALPVEQPSYVRWLGSFSVPEAAM